MNLLIHPLIGLLTKMTVKHFSRINASTTNNKPKTSIGSTMININTFFL
jgi:hypothetical protein